jgi:hypothetical protein
MFKMKIKTYVLLLALFISLNSQIVSEVDFAMGSVYTGVYMWENFIGVSIDYDNVQDLLNNTLFQTYQLNSFLRGDWSNIWMVSLKTPLGHKYNCSALAANVTNSSIECKFETQGNTTYWKILGDYIWNTAPQPNWCIGYDMQGVNLTLSGHQ